MHRFGHERPHRRKVTKQQEEELAKLYLKHGKSVASALCIALGVNPQYAMSAAYRRGYLRNNRSEGSGRRKVTKEVEADLIRHYIEQGPVASAERCASLGLHPNYAAVKARESGLARPRWRAGNRYKPEATPHKKQSGDVSKITFGDKRWARAIAAGSVVA